MASCCPGIQPNFTIPSDWGLKGFVLGFLIPNNWKHSLDWIFEVPTVPECSLIGIHKQVKNWSSTLATTVAFQSKMVEASGHLK